jgi:hypothetical protein
LALFGVARVDRLPQTCRPSSRTTTGKTDLAPVGRSASSPTVGPRGLEGRTAVRQLSDPQCFRNIGFPVTGHADGEVIHLSLPVLPTADVERSTRSSGRRRACVSNVIWDGGGFCLPPMGVYSKSLPMCPAHNGRVVPIEVTQTLGGGAPTPATAGDSGKQLVSTPTLDKRVHDFVRTRRQLFIDGQLVDAKSGKTFEALLTLPWVHPPLHRLARPRCASDAERR